jgi:sugar transferase EpsL
MRRAVDILMALVGIVVLSPVLLVIAVAVRISMGKPVLFTQVRPGRHGAPFRIFKFRTMRECSEDRGAGYADAERLTPLGSLLRKSSLDELPELFNVLIGDMSIIGPRPLLMEYLELYSPEQARRHEVRPGITGWAQVNGRNAISWEQKFALDVWYIDHRSFLLDLRILWLTIVSVVQRRGISQPGSATAERFSGTPR